MGSFLLAVLCHTVPQDCWSQGMLGQLLLMVASPEITFSYPQTVTGSVQVSASGLNRRCVNQKCSGGRTAHVAIGGSPKAGFSCCPVKPVWFLYTRQGTASGL